MKQQVALITGANRGIGKEIALEFAKNKVNVIINYCHHEEEAIKLKDEINSKYDISCMIVKCDISREEEVEKMVNKIIDTYGRIDILVNNAAISRDSLLFDKSIKEFKRILDVNIIGTFLCSKYVGKIMKEQKYGKIINISSNNAIDSYYPESCDYDASKSGVISLTHNFAKELAPYVYVNCICPGWISTESNGLTYEQINKERRKILLNRFGKKEEVAALVIFLASKKASYINDSIIKIDGGRNYD